MTRECAKHTGAGKHSNQIDCNICKKRNTQSLRLNRGYRSDDFQEAAMALPPPSRHGEGAHAHDPGVGGGVSTESGMYPLAEWQDKHW